MPVSTFVRPLTLPASSSIHPLSHSHSLARVPQEYVAMAAILVPFLLMISMGGTNFIIDLVAYLYPAYASVRAIETDGTDDDTLWLTYWLIFSLFKLFEGVADSLLQYIPLYTIAKCTFLVWCFHPTFKGAQFCYDAFIKPNVVPMLNFSNVDEKKKDK